MQTFANGLTLEFDTFGPADGRPAVLLVMGLGQQLIAWPEEFCELIADGGFHVVRFDNRDVGLSTKIEGQSEISVPEAFIRRQMGVEVPAPYTLEDLASDAFGLADALDLGRFHLVGTSMGGMVAQIMAARHPHRLRSLTSIASTSGEAHLPAGRPEALALLGMKRPNGTAREALIEFGVQARSILAGPGYPTSDEDKRALTAQAIDRMWYPPGFVRQTLAVLASPSRASLLTRMTVPTLVIHGRDDPLVPVEHGMRTAELVPGARLEVIDGLGHDFPPGARGLMARLIVAHARAH